jgi:hypothetical protein
VWPRSPARSLSDLFVTPGPALYLPRYPCYGPGGDRGEARAGDFDYFYLRGPRYLSCQASRFLLFGGAFLTLADQAALDLAGDWSGYWGGFYREHFPGRYGAILRHSGPEGHFQRVAEHPGHRVVSPHPFHSHLIPAERYYLDPALVARLNDKGRLQELTDRVPRAVPLTPAAFAQDEWRERWPLPFVVKVTRPSGGGDGVALCHREADLRAARARFAGHPVKVQEYLAEARANISVQLRVAPNGDLAFIGASRQRVEGSGYRGNLIDPQWFPPPPVALICDQVARRAAALGWHGVCGLDLMEDAEGEVWLIDPNFRINGSTPFYLLGDYLATRHRHPLLTTGYFCYPGPPEEFFECFHTEIHRRELLPIGAHYDPSEDGSTRIYAAVISDDDPQAQAGLLAAFAARHLTPGIHL